MLVIITVVTTITNTTKKKEQNKDTKKDTKIKFIQKRPIRQPRARVFSQALEEKTNTGNCCQEIKRGRWYEKNTSFKCLCEEV